jgi:hypothetical protein
MRTLRALLLIPVAALLLGACGDDTAGTNNDSPGATTPAGELPDQTLPVADSGAGAATLPADTTPITALDGPVQIDIVVGVDSGENRVERVKAGQDITLNITNPGAADEFHVHGVDIEQAADAGQMATMNFTIDEPGTYEVESHVTEDVLVIIEVS